MMGSYSLFQVLVCLLVGLGYGAFTMWWLGRSNKRRLVEKVQILETRANSFDTELCLAACSLENWIGKAGALTDEVVRDAVVN